MIDENDKVIIGEIIKLYNENSKYKERMNKIYDSNPIKLRLQELYALEEILRYGNKSYYSRLTSLGENKEEILKEYTKFITDCNNDKKFLISKMRDYKNNRRKLRSVEIFAISLMLVNEEVKHDYKYVDYDYDDYADLKYKSDSEIRESVSNVFFADLIYKLLNEAKDPIIRSELQPIIDHQKSPGLIASVDKPKMLEFLRECISYDYKGVINGIDIMFNQAKFYLSAGFGEKSFDFFSKHRSNITVKEVFDIKPKQKRK